MKQLILLLFLLTSTTAFSQSNQDLTLLSEVIEKPTKVDYTSFKIDSDNEIKIVLSSLFLFYKNFISSQDSQRCSFHPLAQSMAFKAYKKKEYFWAV